MAEIRDRVPQNSPDASGSGPAEPSAREIRESMETVVLPVRAGATPSDKPPVEIYLGTEPAQYRANRVFGFSIERVRDPGREVRIHLMSELPGFNRRMWTTGFTNYRFAIPAFQEGQGRAIYNDEDQIYLTDPGELFDHEIGTASHLSISDTESSVMLIDCERMAPIWTLERAQKGWKKSMLRKASKASGIRGDLDPGWNARDEEFQPGRSHLLHYTTLHTQPWRPFPERFVYQKGAYTQIWHDLEREAIAEGFELFTCESPSRGFVSLLGRLKELPVSELGSGIGVSGVLAGGVESLARKTKSASLLEVQPDLRGDQIQAPGRFGLDSERRVGILEFLSGLDEDERFDGVLCVEGLEDLPVWDVPWVIDALFARARRFVYVAVRTPETLPSRRLLLPPQGTTHTLEWWRSHFEAASKRHPELAWELMSARGRSFEREEQLLVRTGGQRPDRTPPRVWTLSDGAPGNDCQLAALTDALGWPAEKLEVRLNALSGLPLMSRGAHLNGLDSVRSPDSEHAGRVKADALLAGDFPDLLIVAGRRVAPIARWIRERSRGRTQVVALGPKAATPADAVDLAVTPKGAQLFPHPNRLETDRPLTHTPEPTEAWRSRLAEIPGRKIVLLLGSGTVRLGLDDESAIALGRLVKESAESLGASVLVSASRRSRASIFEGCLRGLGHAAFVHRETPEQRDDERPWSALVEAADLFVVAGLGETTLAEVCATGKPVFLSPQLAGGGSFWARLRDGVIERIVERSQARPINDRGTVRPQEGLELISAKLIDRGWVRPRRDAEALRGRLVRAGHARLLRAPIRGTDLEGFAAAFANEVDAVARRVRNMLGVPADASETEMTDATHDL